jgi:hypothetical protein
MSTVLTRPPVFVENSGMRGGRAENGKCGRYLSADQKVRAEKPRRKNPAAESADAALEKMY